MLESIQNILKEAIAVGQTSAMTDEQKRNIERIFLDTFDEMNLSGEVAQKLLKRADEFNTDLKKLFRRYGAPDLLLVEAINVPEAVFDFESFFKKRNIKFRPDFKDIYEKIVAEYKKEDRVSQTTTLLVYDAIDSIYDWKVFKLLGNQIEVDLSCMFRMIAGQPNGESGSLLVNRKSNAFFVEIKHEKYVLFCIWDEHHKQWIIRANIVIGDPYGDFRHDGSRIFTS